MGEVGGFKSLGMNAAARIIASLSVGVLMSGCASFGEIETPSFLSSSTAAEKKSDIPLPPQTDLQKATEYWGEEFSKKPRDIETALSYAKNLKAMGQKQQAMGVLQQASLFHSTDKRLNSEYGRLALELDQVSVAERMLAAADDPVTPDWRVVSARGTAMAKQGRHKEAIEFYERALQLSPDQPSILNNLALAYAMNGEAPRAEETLRKAAANGGASPKVKQNLALVLGLQGKYDEATRVGTDVGSTATTSANVDIIKQMVQLPAKPYTAPGQAGAWEPVVASATPAAAAWQPAIKPAAANAQGLKPAATETPKQADQAPIAAAGASSVLRPSTN